MNGSWFLVDLIHLVMFVGHSRDLIDIKTVKSPSFKRNYFDQLACYAALHRLAGGSDFRRVGVYFARHGRLEMISADAIYGGRRLDEFLPAFKRMAEEMFGRSSGAATG